MSDPLRWARVRVLLPVAAVLLLFCRETNAHDRGTSYSSWTLNGRDAHVVLRIADLEITRFPWAAEPETAVDQALRRYLGDRLQLRAGGQRCTVAEAPHPLATTPGNRAYEWRLRCPQDGELSIHTELMFDVSPAHLHFARLTRDGQPAIERVLSEKDNEWALDQAADGHSEGATIPDYVLLGIEHILTGYDHLAFVAALLLLAGSLGEVARVVTGFTVAHTITLGLMALGYLRPERAPIEALIGLSIALVAAENSWRLSRANLRLPGILSLCLLLLAGAAHYGFGQVAPVTLVGLSLFIWCYFGLLQRSSRAATLRWAIAFVFGLIHGFGFAGVLAEAGLPSDRTLPALLGFNVGVELGQLAVVAVAWPLLQLLARRRAAGHRLLIEVGSAAVFALGLYWFLVRSYG